MINIPNEDRELIKAMGENGRFFSLLEEQSKQFENRPSDYPAFAGYLQARMYTLLLHIRRHEEIECHE